MRKVPRISGKTASGLMTRRKFARLLAIAAGSALVGTVAGCSNDEDAGSKPEPDSTDEAGRPADAAGQTSAGTNAANQTGASDKSSDSAGQANPEQTEPENPTNQIADSQTNQEEPVQTEKPQAAVIYFSQTGKTAQIAERIADILDVDPQVIEAAEPYTAADIDYNTDCRANREQQDDLSIRPALADPAPATDADVVFLGYPIWWSRVPRIVLTYAESGVLAGKTVVPFCMSGSSGIEDSLPELNGADASVTWKPGHRFSTSDSDTALESFVEEGLA